MLSVYRVELFYEADSHDAVNGENRFQSLEIIIIILAKDRWLLAGLNMGIVLSITDSSLVSSIGFRVNFHINLTGSHDTSIMEIRSIKKILDRVKHSTED